MTETRTYPQRARQRIAGTKIIDRLFKHVNGEIDMSPTQVRAASVLLNKVLPDMKSVEVDLNTQLKTVSTRRLTDEQLMAIASGAYKGQGVIQGECETVQEPLKLVTDQ